MTRSFDAAYCRKCLDATRDQLDDPFFREKGVTAVAVRLEGEGDACVLIVDWQDHAGRPRQTSYDLRRDFGAVELGPPEHPDDVAMFISTDLLQR